MTDAFGRALAADLVLAESGVDQRHLTGPFDIIGDVHGCIDELVTLFGRLGYGVEFHWDGDVRRVRTTAPAGRTAVFVGDLIDRGPSSADVLRIAMAMQVARHGLAVIGNHDVKLLRWLRGEKPMLTHALQATVFEIEAEPRAFRDEVTHYLAALPLYLWLAGGALVVAHAGIEAARIGRMSPAIRRFCIFGDTDGKSDHGGLPVRYNWAARYHGHAEVVYGHTPVAIATRVNRTVCIDTGCCFGGTLTALRWPEGEVVSVPATREHVPRLREFGLPPER